MIIHDINSDIVRTTLGTRRLFVFLPLAVVADEDLDSC